jgi:hypothetical protein
MVPVSTGYQNAYPSFLKDLKGFFHLFYDQGIARVLVKLLPGFRRFYIQSIMD